MREPSVVGGTDPYPWPWDGRFSPDRLALAVCGVQRVHADASVDVGPALDVIGVLSSAARRSGAVVCHVRHSAPGPTRRPLLARVGDADWAPVLRPGPDDILVETPGHDGFCSETLDLQLRARGRDLLVAVGLASEVTVSGTVRSANDRGYECLTLSDAVAPLSRSTGHHELHSVTMSGGIFGAVGTSAGLLGLLALASADRPPRDTVPVGARGKEHP